MSSVWKALADPTRRAILLQVSRAPAPVNHIAEQFQMSRPAVSKHLRVLEASGLVAISSSKEDARQRICEAKGEAIQEIEIYLEELRQFWNQKLDALGDFLDVESGK